MELLEIRNRAGQTVSLEPAHAAEIREYLMLLDLTQNVDIVTMPGGEKLPRTVIAQPGLRYAQAKALIESLLLDPAFSDLSITERNSVQERVLSEIMGRMMEDAILLETKLANPKKQVFVLQFAIGEFDMVVFDPASSSCEIYEIKHSAEIVSEQTCHLIDEEKCRATEHRFGTIKGKYVIYRGPAKMVGEVQYYNIANTDDRRSKDMAISYNKLWKLLVDKKMSKADLRRAAGIAPNTMTKLRRDEEVKLSILKKICFALNVDIGDIMEFLPEDQ